MYFKKLFLYFFVFVYAVPAITHKIIVSKYHLPEHVKKSLIRKTASSVTEVIDAKPKQLSEAECKQLEMAQLKQEYLQLEKRKNEILAILLRDQVQTQTVLQAQQLQSENDWWNFYLQMTMNSWQFQAIEYGNSPYQLPNLEMLATQQAQLYSPAQFPSLGLSQDLSAPSSVEQIGMSALTELLPQEPLTQFPVLPLDKSMAPAPTTQGDYFWF